MKKAEPFLVNENPNYRFAELPKMADTQLVMALQGRFWDRLAEYIPAFESVSMAGRFGADPGDYEWEWIAQPEGVQWWRRAANGQESLCGLALAVHRREVVELYGLVEIDENSPFWADVIPEEAANAMPLQARNLARATGRPEELIRADLYREFFAQRGMITAMPAGQPALRRGTVREVERFRDALKGLITRAAQAHLPSEVRKTPPAK